MRWRRITGFSGFDLGPTQDVGPPGAQAIEVHVGARDVRDAWRRIHREQPQPLDSSAWTAFHNADQDVVHVGRDPRWFSPPAPCFFNPARASLDARPRLS